MLVLQKERERQGFSRSRLSREAKVQPNIITWVETIVIYGTGKKQSPRYVPYEGQLERLADALGWAGDPTALLDEVEE